LNKDCIKKYNENNALKLYEDYSEDDYCGICMVAGLG
jgi:hypothetical protein